MELSVENTLLSGSGPRSLAHLHGHSTPSLQVGCFILQWYTISLLSGETNAQFPLTLEQGNFALWFVPANAHMKNACTTNKLNLNDY